MLGLKLNRVSERSNWYLGTTIVILMLWLGLMYGYVLPTSTSDGVVSPHPAIKMVQQSIINPLTNIW